MNETKTKQCKICGGAGSVGEPDRFGPIWCPKCQPAEASKRIARCMAHCAAMDSGRAP